MKPEVLDRLRDAHDFHGLAKALLALCEPYGPVHSFKLVHNRGAARVACFIELESPRQQPVLVRALGARALEGAACLEIPVEKDFGRAATVAAIAPPAGFEPRLAQLTN